MLGQKEREKIELAESLKRQEAERKKLKESEKYLQSRTTYGRISGALNRPSKKLTNYNYPRPITPNPTKEQMMLQEMFSGNNNWGTGQNLPKIDGVLISGGGLIKNNDRCITSSFFGVRR